MSTLAEIKSKAFQQAALRSERTRVIGVLVTLALLLLVATVRALSSSNSLEIRYLPSVVLLAGAMMAYEGLRLRVIGRRMAAQEDLPAWSWKVNLLAEALFPTLALLWFTKSPLLGPYRSLVAPANLMYFFFILLSTLRLDPSLSRWTGLLSGAGYLAVAAYTFVRYPSLDRLFTPAVFFTYGLMIVLGGFVAGAVAGEIRKHVVASLHEAETRRQMERIQQDLDTARTIQQGLLPSQPPVTSRFDIAGWNRPADATGGDYFDWQELPDGRIAVSLADVSGHGIGPALVMAVCRAYARATFPSAGDLPEVMSRLNELLVKDLPSERFVTFVAAWLDPANSRLELISAGHGPLLLYDAASDQFQSIEPQGIPFGLFPGVPYNSPHHFQMAPDDLLVLTTDGFFEWANAQDEQFGLARLQDAIRSSRHLPAAEIIGRLYEAVVEFAGGTNQQDDLTAVVVKRKA
jgi:serine phosphatase RsbU (regulator of sigma subunit)